MSWKQLVPNTGISGNHSGFTDWTGAMQTPPNMTLMEGGIDGTIDGQAGQLITNWAKGMIKWGHTPYVSSGDWGTHTVQVETPDGSWAMGLNASGASASGDTTDVPAGWNVSGKFSYPITRNWSTISQTPTANAGLGNWVGPGQTSYFKTACDSDNSDEWGAGSSSGYGAGTMLWDVQVGGADNNGNIAVSAFPRHSGMSITSGVMPSSGVTNSATIFGPCLDYHQSGSAGMWGPALIQTGADAGKPNHDHDDQYIETGHKGPQIEVVDNDFDFATEGVDGGLYLGPEQFMQDFTDSDGNTWYVYSFFRAFQGVYPGGDALGTMLANNGVAFDTSNEDNYYYQLGGSPGGGTTLGTNNDHELLVDRVPGDFVATADGNKMVRPYPGGNRRPIWSDDKVSVIEAFYQNIWSTGGPAGQTTVLGLAHMIDGLDGGDANLSGTGGNSGTFRLTINTNAVEGAEITCETKYAYPFFYSNTNSSFFPAAEGGSSEDVMLKVWSNPDADEGNNRCNDQGLLPFGGESGFVVLDPTTTDWQVLGRFFIVKVANAGGGTTCGGTFDPAVMGANDRLQFRFENLRRCSLHDSGMGYSGNPLAPTDDFPSGSGLTVDNDGMDPVTFNLSSSAYGADTDLTSVEQHINYITGLQTIGDTDGQLILTQDAGETDYMISIEGINENAKMWMSCEPIGSTIEGAAALDDGFIHKVQGGPAASGDTDYANRMDGNVAAFEYFGHHLDGSSYGVSHTTGSYLQEAEVGDGGFVLKNYISMYANGELTALDMLDNGLMQSTSAALVRVTPAMMNTYWDMVPSGGHIVCFAGHTVDTEFYEEGTTSSTAGVDGVDDKIFIHFPDLL